jgi:hypothetical protein
MISLGFIFLPLKNKKKTKTGNSLVLKYEKNGKNGKNG